MRVADWSVYLCKRHEGRILLDLAAVCGVRALFKASREVCFCAFVKDSGTQWLAALQPGLDEVVR